MIEINNGIIDSLELVISKDAVGSIAASRVNMPMEVLDKNMYIYLQIEASKDLSKVLESAVIFFSIEKNWIDGKNIDPKDIVLLRFKNGEWEELPTSIIGNNGQKINYKAITPGFSLFAVSTKKEIMKDELNLDKIQNKSLIQNEISETAQEENMDLINKINNKIKIGLSVLVIALFSIFITLIEILIPRKLPPYKKIREVYKQFNYK